MKRTKIICTVGPSTDNPEVIERLIEAGMNIARLNFSHGNREDHKNRLQMVRDGAKKCKKIIATLIDTKGPEMRLGFFSNDKEMLVTGETFVLTTKQIQGDAGKASINYSGLPKLLKKGDKILLSDGLISLLVVDVTADEITTTVLNGGEISSRKRVATPSVALDLPFLSEQDIGDLLFAVENNMDFVAASFVQRAEDVIAIRKVLEENNSQMGIIAKIENYEGLNNIEEIIKVSDGIMVARGDLGVEIPTEEVPLAQKHIIDLCNESGLPVITATQMLESMMNNPRPTRAEASDVANAILDGSDAIMLSGETASGDYPIEAVEMMASIAAVTESALHYENLLLGKGDRLSVATMTDSISRATAQIAYELDVAAIIASSETGYTARMLAKYRPKSRVIAVTPHEISARRMQLYWGVEALVGDSMQNTDEMVNNTVLTALNAEMIKPGDMVIITAGVPVGTAGSTNLINVIIAGDIILKAAGLGTKIVRGKICTIKNAEDLHKFKKGDIIVVSTVNDEISKHAVNASAIISVEGGLTCAAAIIGISYGIPTVVGANGAFEKLKDGMKITLDSARGLVYYGSSDH